MTRFFSTLSPVSRVLGLVALPCLLATGCRDPREITEAEGDMAVVVEGNNRFALNLYDAASAEEGNLFFSPFSINAALSMTYAGAEGETEAQMADVLGIEIDEEAWHENLAALADDLSGEHYRGYTLHTANQVWGQQGVPFREDYLDVLETLYSAPLEEEDFASDPSGATGRINDWVSDQTQGHVDELFESGDLDPLTRLVLANAIYFDADWENRFEVGGTTDRDFTLPSGEVVQVPTMTQEADLAIASVDGVRLLEMPYRDEEISMVVLLPDDPAGLEDFEADLTADNLHTWIGSLSESSVQVEFPSFELETEIPLTELLVELGMTDAFDDALSDFTGMVAREDMEANYYIQTTRHKAYVLVDERGTTAAAATGVAVGTRSVDAGPIPFVVDRPFLFLIRDMLTDTILFMGRIEDPR